MFRLIFKMFIGLLSTCTIGSFDGSLASNSKGYIKCVLLNNWPCQAWPTLFNINSNEPLYYPFTDSVNKCGGSCNSIDDPYARVSVPDKIKNINEIGFNLMSRVNEAKMFSSVWIVQV